MKPKSNRAGTLYEAQGMDCCQTPAYALDPLLPFLPPRSTIWEPAEGKGNISQALANHGHTVIGTDIANGINFFEYPLPNPNVDMVITNPPYSIKYPWLQRCYELGKPFALLVPVETIGSKAAQALFERYGFEQLLLNRRVNFEMPQKGLSGGGAQFPVFWLCWRLLSRPVVFGKLPTPAEQRKAA